MVTEDFPKVNLFSKMASIMSNLSRVKKDGRVEGRRGYGYASKDAVYDALRSQMGEHRIALFANIVDVVQDDIVSKSETKGLHTVAKLQFTLACGDTGQTFTANWVGESSDYGDKGISQAASLGEKYFLLSTFMLSTGDEPDAEQKGSVEGGRTKNKPKPSNVKKGDFTPPIADSDTVSAAQVEKEWKNKLLDLTKFLYSDPDSDDYNVHQHKRSLKKRLNDTGEFGIKLSWTPEGAAVVVLGYRAHEDLGLKPEEYPAACEGFSLGEYVKKHSLEYAWKRLISYVTVIKPAEAHKKTQAS